VSPSPAGPPHYANRASLASSQRRSFTTTTGPNAPLGGLQDDSDGWAPLTDSGPHEAIWPSTLNTGGHPVINPPPSALGASGFQAPQSLAPTSGDQFPHEPRSGRPQQPRGRGMRMGQWRGGQR
jgi:hypothetical protein